MAGPTDEFVRRLDEEVLPQIERVTVLLCGAQDGELEANSTGVLYSIAGHHFILTAAHDLRVIVESSIPLCVLDTDPPELRVPLVGAQFHCTEHGSQGIGARPARDVAAIHLPDDAVEQLRCRKSFLAHNKVDRSRNRTYGFHVLFGYPAEWAQGQPVPRALAFLSREYRGKPAQGSAFDPHLHVALDFQQNAIALPSAQGACLPDILGVSGCGIWRVADATPGGLRNWSPSEYRLVALQHSWARKSNYVYGTWIAYCLDLIEHEYPDASSPMGLVYPR